MIRKVWTRGKHIFRRHLFLSNVTISFCLSGVGDLLQQAVEQSKWNLKRTAVMSTSFGLTSGFLCHHWYNYLDRVLPGRGVRVVLRKVVWDQVFFSPVCIVACILVCSRLEKTDIRTAVDQTIQLGGRIYIAEWIIWPPAQFFNFAFLPTRLRVLYDNLVSLAFDTYTSHVKFTVPLQNDFNQNLLRSGWFPSHINYVEVLHESTVTSPSSY